MAAQVRSALVYGGSGALGRAVVSRFASSGWNVVNVDFDKNSDAHHNIVLDKKVDWKIHVANVKSSMPSPKVQAVIHTAGGWAGGSIKDESVLTSADFLFDVNLRSAIAASHIAANHLAPKGLLCLTGATAALRPTPSMLVYGISKVSIHHIIRSLAAKDGGLPEGCVVAGILPETIDTPSNRAAMPNADVSKWTPPATIADMVLEWANMPSVYVTNGILYSFTTRNNSTGVFPISSAKL